MDDLISREALLDIVGKIPQSWEYGQAISDVYEIIKSAPTLTLDDLRPKGRWIGTGYDGYADGCLVYDLWECSECRAEFGCVGDPPPYEFCPSCGADMRGGGEG